MQKGIGSGRRRLLRKQRFHRTHDLEGVERLHEVCVGSGLVREEEVDLTIEKEHDGAGIEIAHLLTLAHGQARRDTAHVADLQIEQHEGRIDLLDRRDHVDTGTNPVEEMGTGDGGLDLVGEGVGIGGEKDVRHAPDRTRRPGFAHAPVPNRGRVSGAQIRGYHAAVLEIRVDRPEGADFAQLSPEGELDAYSVAAFREAFAELGEESRLIVNLGGVQFMDSAGLGALIGGIRKVRENEGAIAVFCDRANITRLLHTTGFDRIVPVCEDMPSAIAALDQPQS